jgi:hypothetical protein
LFLLKTQICSLPPRSGHPQALQVHPQVRLCWSTCGVELDCLFLASPDGSGAECSGSGAEFRVLSGGSERRSGHAPHHALPGEINL